METRRRFGLVLATMAEVYNEPMSEVKAEAYWRVLARHAIEDLEAAAWQAIASRRYFPRPCEWAEGAQACRVARIERERAERAEARGIVENAVGVDAEDRQREVRRLIEECRMACGATRA